MKRIITFCVMTLLSGCANPTVTSVTVLRDIRNDLPHEVMAERFDACGARLHTTHGVQAIQSRQNQDGITELRVEADTEAHAITAAQDILATLYGINNSSNDAVYSVVIEETRIEK